MKFIQYILFWLLTLCLGTNVRSQTFLDEYRNQVENKTIEDVEVFTDSLISKAVAQENYLNATQLAHGILTILRQHGNNNEKQIKYGRIEVENYERLNLINENYALALHNLGLLFYKKREYKFALEHHLKVLQSNASSIPRFTTFYEIAKSYYRLGDFYKAEDFYSKSIAFHESQKNYKTLIVQYSALVRVYNKIRTKESQQKLIELLKKLESLQSKTTFSPRQRISLNNYYAFYYNNPLTFNFEKSKSYLLKTLQLSIQSDDSIYMCASSNNLGDLYNEAKNDSALIYLEKSLNYCNNRSSFYYTYSQMSYAYLNSKKLDKSLEYIDKSIRSFVPDSSNIEQLSASDFTNVSDKVNLMFAFDRKAEILIESYKQDQDLNHIENALNQLVRIDEFIDVIDQNASAEKSQLHWRMEASKIYSKAVWCASILNRQNLAFYFNEKSKALLLTESILKNNVLVNLPKELSDKELDYKRKILALENKNDEISKSTKDSLFNLKLSYQTYTDSLKTEFPEYYDNKAKTSLFSLEMVKKKIKPEDFVITYNIDQSSKQCTVLAHTKDYDYLYTFILDDKLKETIDSYRRLIAKPFQTTSDKTEFELASNTIYNVLFPEELQMFIQNKRLIIIPDGDLQNIPFEALITNKDSNTYLIENNVISYAYSMSFLLQNNMIKRAPVNDFTAFAPISFAHNDLATLKDTEEELKSIQKLFNSETFIGPLALKDSFLKRSQSSKIIHLATHANATDDPWIAFYDDKLKLHELYTFKNQADLAVLSACETTQGELAVGEGVMSLARGFFYSGAKSVVSSLWSVDDSSTSTIMTHFYANLKAGETKSEALRNAKLNYLQTNSLSESSPYYWSSFILIGDTESLTLKQNNIILFVFISLLLLAIILLMLRKKIKS